MVSKAFDKVGDGRPFLNMLPHPVRVTVFKS
jgi:hypothetical protein